VTQPLNLGNCCGPSIAGIRKIIFPDGDHVGLVGLDAVLESVFKEGKLPNDSTAAELIDRLRTKNYIPGSPFVEELYRKALLKEYQRYYENRKR
jgi:hypothetical protein